MLASGFAFALNISGLVQVVRGWRDCVLHCADRFYTLISDSIEVPMNLALVINLFAPFPTHLAAIYFTFLVFLLCQAVVFVAHPVSLIERNGDHHEKR